MKVTCESITSRQHVCILYLTPNPYDPFTSTAPSTASSTPPSGTNPSASILSNFLTSSAVCALVSASTTLLFSSGVISLPFAPGPFCAPLEERVLVLKAEPGTLDVVGIESWWARELGREVRGSVRSFLADSRTESLIRSKSRVWRFPLATWKWYVVNPGLTSSKIMDKPSKQQTPCSVLVELQDFLWGRDAVKMSMFREE